MRFLPDELRLLHLVLLNAIVIGCTIRFVRRLGVRSGPQIGADAMLLWYLVQYLSVTLPGLIGILSPISVSTTALLLSAAMLVIRRVEPESVDQMTDRDRVISLGAIGVLCAFIGTVIFNQRYLPPTANDSLTYHLPAAVHWLQTGRLSLFPTWFFNPANTYSPLAGSTFITWMLAPIGNDAIARFVQAPALIMIFLVTLELCRKFGASVSVATLIALAACCSRPFISQVCIAKDDLFLAAMFGAAVLAVCRYRPSPWRLGIALGLMLATKYTALLSGLVFVLAIESMIRSRWKLKQLSIAAVCMLALAGPWYLRNLVLTGDPVYPIDLAFFTGMFGTQRADALRSIQGVWRTVVTSYFGLTIPLTIALMACWVVGLVRAPARARLLIFCGPLAGVGLFVVLSPYSEVRFVYSSILLLFVASSLAFRRGWIAVGLAVISIATSFIPGVLQTMIEPAIVAILIAGAVILIIETGIRARSPNVLRGVLAVSLLGGAALCASVYVYWQKYIADYRQQIALFWGERLKLYGDLGDAWEFVREKLPSNERLAYTGTNFVYPLMGFELDRPVFYASSRPHIAAISDLGRINEPLAGEQIDARVTQLTFAGSDAKVWKRAVIASGARYLFIAKSLNPPELQFVAGDSDFRPVFDNSAAAIYEIAR